MYEVQGPQDDERRERSGNEEKGRKSRKGYDRCVPGLRHKDVQDFARSKVKVCYV